MLISMLLAALFIDSNWFSAMIELIEVVHEIVTRFIHRCLIQFASFIRYLSWNQKEISRYFLQPICNDNLENGILIRKHDVPVET